MKTIRRTRPARGPAPAAGALLVALFLFLYAFAASAALHQAIHSGDGNPSHHCAISLLAQGQIDAPGVDAPVSFTFASCDSAPLFCLSVFSAAVEFPPPARGPPPALFRSLVPCGSSRG